MAKAIVKQKPFTPRAIKIKGNTYRYALKDFRIQPASKRVLRGAVGGVQYTYQIDTQADLDEMLNYLLDKAQDYADRNGDDNSSYLGMCDDAGHFLA